MMLSLSVGCDDSGNNGDASVSDANDSSVEDVSSDGGTDCFGTTCSSTQVCCGDSTCSGCYEQGDSGNVCDQITPICPLDGGFQQVDGGPISCDCPSAQPTCCVDFCNPGKRYCSSATKCPTDCIGPPID
ncbi:MAG: hypothetical protein IPJ88_11890 [Myxococcales bacterium]|nr:MAG: hypothetical protein IPJ88_11890 [Myxococcales bacterium]